MAIFVDTLAGDNAFSGAMDKPKKTIQAGIAAAQSAGKDVYISVGTYPESITMADGVSLYGG